MACPLQTLVRTLSNAVFVKLRFGLVIPDALSNILCIVDDYLQIRDRRAVEPRAQHNFTLLHVILEKEIRKD